MNNRLYQDALQISRRAVDAVLPDAAVKKAIRDISFSGKLILVAAGKAAWQMAQAVLQSLTYPVSEGIVITKYGHVPNELPGITCFETGHPLPDDNSFRATEEALRMTENLTAEDTVLFLLSGGGSALFEKPTISGKELLTITDYMLKAGMDIREMNTIRKRLSLVKGGKFAAHCAPARIESIILSDIIGDALDMIASGPSAVDNTSCEDALAICQKYRIPLSDEAQAAMRQETPRQLANVTNRITGSVRQLCHAAAKTAEELGYTPVLLGDDFTCEAKDLGKLLAEKLLAKTLPYPQKGGKITYIAGGETVVHVSGNGLGGRNQELALTAGKYLAGQKNMAVLSIGPTGTNVNDMAIALFEGSDTAELIENAGTVANADTTRNADTAMTGTALIAMSGGVDSSVAALLVKQQGYNCIGCTMKLYDNADTGILRGHTCCSLDDVEDAEAVARRLRIPYYVFNFTSDFREKIIDKFVSCYGKGLTPNPCIDCNRYMKFEKLFDRAKILGCEYIVTGHYARIEFDGKQYLLKKAADESKDQSYVLYSLTQEQLSHTLFPLGTMTKSETRKIAEENGFLNAGKPDSQDICFVPDGDYAKVVELHSGRHPEPGNFIDTNGRVLGRHKGIIHYTVGQRKGLGLSFAEPHYVLSVRPADNTVVLGTYGELFADTLTAVDFNWISGNPPELPMRCKAKIRYRQQEQWCTTTAETDGTVKVRFDEPQRAITPGQAVVLYDGETVLGGGTIDFSPVPIESLSSARPECRFYMAEAGARGRLPSVSHE